MPVSHLALVPARPALPRPPAVTLESLFAAQPVEKLAAGEAVFWEGDGAAHLFQVVEGWLRLYRLLPDGRRAVLGFCGAGELLAVACPGTYPYTAEAVTPVRLRRLGRGRVQAEALRPALQAQICAELAAAQEHVVVLGQLGAEERVAHFLVTAARRPGARRAVELAMTRQDMADYLGLTIETVCRALSKLKRAGLIGLEGRHRVVLRRPGALQRLAGALDNQTPQTTKTTTTSM
jgi:CRP/FNR family transcriptional regulator